MISLLLLFALALAIIFAVNMGCSGTAPSFASAYGSKILNHKWIALLFTIFVIFGSAVLGQRVVKTLSKGLIPQDLITPEIALTILLSACIALVFANILKIPQSTSQVTVLAVVGIGLFYGSINARTFMIMLPIWIILPLASLCFAFILGKYVHKRIARKLESKETLLKFFVIATCCYVAFGIGSNNVANAAAPLVAAETMRGNVAVLLLAPFFGVGSFFLGSRVLKTVGTKITELNLISASLVSIVTGTLLICASVVGIPQSLVQMNTIAIIGIGLANHGAERAKKKMIGKIVLVWLIAPVLSLLISLALVAMLHYIL